MKIKFYAIGRVKDSEDKKSCYPRPSRVLLYVTIDGGSAYVEKVFEKTYNDDYVQCDVDGDPVEYNGMIKYCDYENFNTKLDFIDKTVSVYPSDISFKELMSTFNEEDDYPFG